MLSGIVNFTACWVVGEMGFCDGGDRQVQIEVYIRILDIKTGFAEGYEVAEITREDSKEVDSKQIIYLIKDGGIVWNVFFSTNADEFEARLPISETSIRTLSTQP